MHPKIQRGSIGSSLFPSTRGWMVKSRSYQDQGIRKCIVPRGNCNDQPGCSRGIILSAPHHCILCSSWCVFVMEMGLGCRRWNSFTRLKIEYISIFGATTVLTYMRVGHEHVTFTLILIKFPEIQNSRAMSHFTT